MDSISSKNFFDTWLETVNEKKTELTRDWRNAQKFTSIIKGSENSVIGSISKRLGLLSYEQDYYSIDTILYSKNDLVPDLPPNRFWFRDIRVAFEHENDFRSGLFQEVAHLLITNCDLKVLVSYPNSEKERDLELTYLHQIISGHRQSVQFSNDESFLIILGYENNFEWEGLVYKKEEWKKIKHSS